METTPGTAAWASFKRASLRSDTNRVVAPAARGQQGEQPDRPGPCHQHAGARADAAAIAGIDGHCGRFDQRGFLVGQALGHFGDIVFMKDRFFRHAAPLPGQAGDGDLVAQMEQAPLGVIVAHARHDQRLDRNAISDCHGRHAFADGLDRAAEFMAQDLGAVGFGERVRRAAGNEDRAGCVFVKIRPADADIAVANTDLAGAGVLGRFHALDPQIARGMETQGFHEPLLFCLGALLFSGKKARGAS
jgi:hypothetical protein